MHLCPECGKHYLSKISLTRNMVIHSQESKFLCEDCGKSFGCNDHLEGHKVQITKLQKDLHAEIVQKYLYTKRTCCTINVKGYAQSHTF